MKRIIQNLGPGFWHLRRALNAAEQESITAVVREVEQNTSAQIKVVIESSLNVLDVMRGQTARERALEVFGLERVWDTSHNNGILLYLLLSEHDAEIVADRGFNAIVEPDTWRSVCRTLEAENARTSFSKAICAAVCQIGEIAQRVFPSTVHPNEISDHVTMR